MCKIEKIQITRLCIHLKHQWDSNSKVCSTLVSKIFCYDRPSHKLRSNISPILICKLLYILALNLTTSVIRVKIEYQHNCTESWNTYMSHIKPDNIYYGQNCPYQWEKGQSPPEYFIIGRINIFFIDFALKFPQLFTFFIEIYPPSQSNKNSSCDILNDPEVNSSCYHYEL